MREGLSYNDLRGFRSTHNSLTDEEFEELTNDDTGEPMTRRQLREIAREKRALAMEPENEVSERNPGVLSAEEDGLEGGGSGPDAFEEIVARIGGQVRDIMAQLPDRPNRVLEIVQEDLRGLEKRLVGYPGNTVRMQAKFERLREMWERGVIPYTVWGFPFRGDYAGDKNYHGNCSPRIIEQCVWRLTERYRCITLADAGTVSDRSSAWCRCPDCTSRAWR